MTPAPIPLVDLKAGLAPIRGEIDEAMGAVLDNTSFILGAPVESFEKSFAAFLGAKHCIGVANGTDALRLALESLGVTRGDQVITQANTFVATALSISAIGAEPVLVDVKEGALVVDPKDVENAITPRVKCVILVHMFGACADVEAIREICDRKGVLLLEDACQAHGARYKGTRLGNFGRAAAFSFYPGKNLGAFGDGGCVVTNDDDIAADLRFKRNWGSRVKYYHEVKGFNSRLDALQAAILSVKLKGLDDGNESRRRVAEKYSSALDGVGDIVLPQVIESCEPVYHLYVIRTEKRDELLSHLNSVKIGAGIHYPVPVHKLGAYAEEMSGKSYPVAERAADTMISLPCYPEISDEQIDRVVSEIKAFFEGK